MSEAGHAEALTLEQLILAESERLEEFAAAEVEIRVQLAARAWAPLEARLVRLAEQARAIEAADEARAVAARRLQSNLHAASDERLTSLIAALPADLAARLRAAHRRLRIGTLRARGSIARIAAVAGGMSRTIRQLVESLLPAGASYADSGLRHGPARRALIVDRTV